MHPKTFGAPLHIYFRVAHFIKHSGGVGQGMMREWRSVDIFDANGPGRKSLDIMLPQKLSLVLPVDVATLA